MSQLIIYTDLCKGCGQCVKDCVANVLTIENGKCVIKEDKKNSCIKCGHCASICKSNAIQIFGMENEKLSEHPQTVEEVIKYRRSVRQWKNDPIPNEEIREMLNMTRFAPSGGNSRFVKFRVINRPQLTTIIDKLTKDVLNSPYVPEAYKGIFMAQQQFDIVGRNAPHMILAYRDSVENETP